MRNELVTKQAYPHMNWVRLVLCAAINRFTVRIKALPAINALLVV